MNAPICFIDTETTSLRRDREIWELAMVRREPDGTEIEWQGFLMADLSEADPFSLSIGRFYDRHPYGKSVAHEFDGAHELAGIETIADITRREGVWTDGAAANRVVAYTHGAHIVGAVPSFDVELLERLVREKGGIKGWHYHLVDVENLAVGYLRGRQAALGAPSADLNVTEPVDLRPPWSSDELTRLLGLDPVPEAERHTAMGDVRWAMRMYDRVMGTEK